MLVDRRPAVLPTKASVNREVRGELDVILSEEADKVAANLVCILKMQAAVGRVWSTEQEVLRRVLDAYGVRMVDDGSLASLNGLLQLHQLLSQRALADER